MVLICGYGLAGKYQINSGAQILAGDGNPVAGAALVKLSAIDKAKTVVKKKDIRRAGGFVGARHRLRFIIQVRKDEAAGL